MAGKTSHGGRDAPRQRPVTCTDSGKSATVTFILEDACFTGRGYTGMDLQIRALEGDAVIRFVRIIKLNW